jgi:argininosuccinate synthase
MIPKWLHSTYGCDVVTFTANPGQGEEPGPADLVTVENIKGRDLWAVT